MVALEKDHNCTEEYCSYHVNSYLIRLLCVSLSADTFASKVAAIQDQYADASIGNVTGSNAVNVFLGIGVSDNSSTAASLYSLILLDDDSSV